MRRHGNTLLFSTHLGISVTESELLIWGLKVNFSNKANYQTRDSQIVKIIGFFFLGNSYENDRDEQHKQNLVYTTFISQLLCH